MGTYYDFYLEKIIDNDKYLPLKYNGKDSFYYVRNNANEFFYHYGTYFPLSINYMNEEYKKQHIHISNDKDYKENYYLMDLNQIEIDYNNNIHDYAGIISKNDLKKLKTDSDFIPKIIEESVFIKLPNKIKKHYIYHEWDYYYDTSYYLYIIMPIIKEILTENHLKINEVRLLCRIC